MLVRLAAQTPKHVSKNIKNPTKRINILRGDIKDIPINAYLKNVDFNEIKIEINSCIMTKLFF